LFVIVLISILFLTITIFLLQSRSLGGSLLNSLNQSSFPKSEKPSPGTYLTDLGNEPLNAGFHSGEDVLAVQQGGDSQLAPGTPVLTITVEATTTTIVPGQTITYNIELHHVGGDTPIQGRLLNPWSSGIYPHNDGILLTAVGTVSPTKAQVSQEGGAAGLLWEGGLGPDSRLQIQYPAEVKPCYDPDPVTLRNSVFVQGQSGGSLTGTVEIEVDCLPAVDPANIDVSAFWGADTSTCFWCLATDGEIVPGKAGIFRVELANSDSNATTLGLVGIFPGRGFNIGMPPTLERTATLGWKVEEGESLRSSAAGRTALFLVPLAAGETKTVSMPVRLVDDVPPESEFDFQLGYCITFDGELCPGADPQDTTPPPSVEWLPTNKVAVRYRDLGDAPDSTSHFTGTLMPAYINPVVQANYPTVFDPATDPVQGPVHINPRPFHLGFRASPEAEADIGPDLDPTNNIIPLAHIPNRDRRDDGVFVNILNFNQCQVTLVPVRIFIRPAAVTFFSKTGGKAYLNIWLDGNHDGDWADNFSCSGAVKALEHIVIDHEIDVVGMGPGQHIVLAPTSPVPWSGQSAWLRATLSERPANKTLIAGDIDYGDGRGPSIPFLLGETEDYLLRPQGAEGAGPDMALDADAGWQTGVCPPDSPCLFIADPPAIDGSAESVSANSLLEIHLTASYFKIEYRNEGSEVAQDVVITHRIPQILEGLEPRIVAQPPLDPDAIWQMPGSFGFHLGDVEPGEWGTIVLSFYQERIANEGACPLCVPDLIVAAQSDITGTTTITSSNDINLANNQSDSLIVFPDTVEAGFSSPGGLFKWTSGTTCHNTFEIRGHTTPNTLVNMFIGGDDSAFGGVLSGNDGYFETLIDLANGLYHILLVPTDPLEFSFALLSVHVNNHLPWNPSSLAFTDSEGKVIQPNVLGAVAIPNFQKIYDWGVGSLIPGETYEMSLEYCGVDPNPALEFSFLGNTVTLTDPDQDNIYSGFLPTEIWARQQLAVSTPLTVSITTGNVETILGGTIQAASSGVAHDLLSGDGLSATVTLLQALGGDPEAGFDIWLGTDYGQDNPQSSSITDGYQFWPEADTYRLVVYADGYQPFRSWQFETDGGPVNPDLPLTPQITDTADYVIEISADGFGPSVLTVPPGSIVKWVNTDSKDHTSTSITPTVSGPGLQGSGGWDSGVLGSGDSYYLQFNDVGTFVYVDRASPFNRAQIVVRHLVYLPLITSGVTP